MVNPLANRPSQKKKGSSDPGEGWPKPTGFVCIVLLVYLSAVSCRARQHPPSGRSCCTGMAPSARIQSYDLQYRKVREMKASTQTWISGLGTRHVTHQKALVSTLGLPCIPLTTCELRTISKLVRPQSTPAPSTNCFKLASSVRNSPAAPVPLPAIPAATRTT
jgi:hypothetical protein